MTKYILCFYTLFLSLNLYAGEIKTVEDYNAQLPVTGVSWAVGDNASSGGYYPSFYTGFIPRVQTPNRIHIRVSRGNQTRLSLILDENTIFDYLYDLKARSSFYQEMVDNKIVDVDPKGAKVIQHLSYFQSIVDNGVLSPINELEKRSDDQVNFYKKSLQKIKTLNPGRVFDIKIDLAGAFLNWRNQFVLPYKDGPLGVKDEKTLVLANELLWGRINLNRELTKDELTKLTNLVSEALVLSDEGFSLSAFDLFKSITDGKYEFKVLNQKQDKLVSALTCEMIEACTLTYPELSAIYPTGTHKATESDRFKNAVSRIATAGLSYFTDKGGRGDVDNIRSESYYGFAPKMDYEGKGNGFHNPAVRVQPSNTIKKMLNIPQEHVHYWTVRRGEVSHGCSRLPLGHVWEMRHTFPVQNSLMLQLNYFGNNSRDFDLFDINADGEPEIMGVKYYVKYDTKGNSGLDKREGKNLEIAENSIPFLTSMYGTKNVFEIIDQQFIFIDPTVSIQTINDYFSEAANEDVKESLIVPGQYKLYQQDYEKDKVQFYTSKAISGFNGQLTGGGKESLGKRLVRLFGRVRGCAPFSDKEACGEKAFVEEKNQILAEIK